MRNEHPILLAVHAYFGRGSNRRILEVDAFLSYLRASIVSLAPSDFAKVSHRLLDIAEQLRMDGDFAAATSLAQTVTASARGSTANRVGAGPLTTKAECAGQRFLRFIDTSLNPEGLTASSTPRAPPRPRETLIEQRWKKMSATRKAALSKLADSVDASLHRVR